MNKFEYKGTLSRFCFVIVKDKWGKTINNDKQLQAFFCCRCLLFMPFLFGWGFPTSSNTQHLAAPF